MTGDKQVPKGDTYWDDARAPKDKATIIFGWCLMLAFCLMVWGIVIVLLVLLWRQVFS